MGKNISKNHKVLQVFFVSRLEKEKGADILLACIKFAIAEKKNVHFHIFGIGSYFSNFSNLDKKYCTMYKNIKQQDLFAHYKMADVVLMPSVFLETFGLVALEAVAHGVPVIGIQKGGVTPFILPEHALKEGGNMVQQIFTIFDQYEKCLPDITLFSYDLWCKYLEKLFRGKNRILLVHDYCMNIGGAEMYVEHVADELRKMGKEVVWFGYAGKISSWKRKWMLLLTPIAFWRGRRLRRVIQKFQPDHIFSHTVLRYIGPWGMYAIKKTLLPHTIMHHDLGLITPYPSRIYQEKDIPNGWNIGTWMRGTISIFSIFSILWKYLLLRILWRTFPNKTHHLVPSEWMKLYISRYIHLQSNIDVFPHTVFLQKVSKE